MGFDMRVLISGAGIAGLTVAYWLKHYGFTPTIVERSPKLLTGGYKIDIRGSALQVLRRMGIYDAVSLQSTDMQGASLVDKDGNVINKLSGEAFGNRSGDDVEILRGALCQILREQISDVEIIFGDSIQEISELSHEVEVKFKKASSRKFDLIIGADGSHSNVRQLVFGDESRFSRDMGIYSCVFSVPNYLNLDRWEMQYSELDKMVALWNSRGDSMMKASFGFTHAAPINLDDSFEQQQILKRVYNQVKGEVPELLKLMSEAPDFYFDVANLINMDHWSNGRVILLGDAAYCASPMSGQGTSLALIGAHILAGELACSSGAYQKAFSQYEQTLRPFVKVNQALAIKVASMMKSQENNTFFSRALKLITRILPGRLTGFLIQFFIFLSARRVNHAANSIVLKEYQV